MSFSRKIITFAVLEASWITWLLVGFSTGGVGGMVERAITLARASGWMRRLDRRRRASVPAVTRKMTLAPG